MKPLCALDGRILPLAEARIDPLDRGWLFGDALYEVVKVLSGTLLHLEPHLRRLAKGLEKTEIPVPQGLESLCSALLEACGLQSGYLYLQVSRGVGSRAHIPPVTMMPTVLVLPFEQLFDPPASRRLRAVSVPDWRWQFRDVKTTSLMATVLGKLRLRRDGTDEVLFVGPQRELREGGSTNVFVRRADAWETHPLDGRILQGVTRERLIQLAAELEMPIASRAPRLAELDGWQEAFLCGTTTGVQPLVELDGRPIGDATAGDWTRRLAEAFDRFEQEELAGATR